MQVVSRQALGCMEPTTEDRIVQGRKRGQRVALTEQGVLNILNPVCSECELGGVCIGR